MEKLDTVARFMGARLNQGLHNPKTPKGRRGKPKRTGAPVIPHAELGVAQVLRVVDVGMGAVDGVAQRTGT